MIFERQREAKRALWASETKYRTLLENLPQRIFLKDAESVYISCNAKYAEDLNAKAVNGKIPVMIDSGFRRGTDIYKALALGATAVGIGRPYMWGLSAFGQEGVERVLEILRLELELAMMSMATSISMSRRTPTTAS